MAQGHVGSAVAGQISHRDSPGALPGGNEKIRVERAISAVEAHAEPVRVGAGRGDVEVAFTVTQKDGKVSLSAKGKNKKR